MPNWFFRGQSSGQMSLTLINTLIIHLAKILWTIKNISQCDKLYPCRYDIYVKEFESTDLNPNQPARKSVPMFRLDKADWVLLFVLKGLNYNCCGLQKERKG